MVILMIFAACYGVLQLAVLGSASRTVRISTLLLAVAAGGYGCGVLALIGEIAVTRWEDPDNPGNGVRVDKGDPNSPNPSQRVDHVVVRQNGRVIGPDGKPISGRIKANPGAHIPLRDWLNWTHWWGP